MASAWYVYAIVDRDTRLPAFVGSDVAELALVPWRKLAAVSALIEDDGAPATADAVLRHEAIVEAVRRYGPALPVRFGTVFRDAASIAAAIAERYESLVADLERLGDKVELSLTVLWATAPSPTDVPTDGHEADASPGRGAGASYLRARAAELRRDEALEARAGIVAREIEQTLGGLALEQRVSRLSSPRIAVRTTYLLDPDAVSTFRAAVEEMRATRHELRVLLSGPWPPYSFARRSPVDGSAGIDARRAALVELLTDEMRGRLG